MYAMTVKSSSTVCFWEECKATTERGAKCEAWKRFGDGYVGDAVEIAIKHADGQVQPVARKTIDAKSAWEKLI